MCGGVQQFHPRESNFEHIMDHFGIQLDGVIIMRALTQFFKWQYPHFMFIYREAFLRDHFGNRHASKYWSSALLTSICTLGLLMAGDDTDRKFSDQYFLATETIVVVSGLTYPSIPTVQAFLCLAFYEIGRGNFSKGWGYSGMVPDFPMSLHWQSSNLIQGIAFRMAQDLGFQKDPPTWISHDSSLTIHDSREY